MHTPMEGIKARERIGRIRPHPGVALPNGKVLEWYINMSGVTAPTQPRPSTSRDEVSSPPWPMVMEALAELRADMEELKEERIVGLGVT